MSVTRKPHRYLMLVYARIIVLTILSYSLLAQVLPRILATVGNSAWNNNAASICANVSDIHIVEFYHTVPGDSSSDAQPYYNGYVAVNYRAYNRNYSYEFLKYSKYTNRTQLDVALHSCCTIHHCINIYYQKSNPGDANETLKNTYEFPSWLSGLIGGLLLLLVFSYVSYRYDYRYYSDLLLINTLGGYKEYKEAGYASDLIV